MVNKEFKPRRRRIVNTKNPKILKKMAAAFAIVIMSCAVYVSYLAPHTLEAKQRIQLESTQSQLIETKKKLEASSKNDAEKLKQIEDIQKQLDETQKQLQAKRSLPVGPTALAAPIPPSPASPVVDNETVAWNFLISQGYTRAQTAGIMGNLMQEHGFKTSDVPGGLGIAQWIGNRRANLMARGDYTNINVQLQFLVDELNTVEGQAKAGILASGSVEGSTMAFSSLFERCGICRNETRIQYAYTILGRH